MADQLIAWQDVKPPAYSGRVYDRIGSTTGRGDSVLNNVWRVVKALIATLSLAAVTLFVVGRFSDGPLGFFSGGAFRSGETATYPADWGFLDDEATIELQLIDPARARTVWVLVEDGEAFIPCGAPNFRLWKQWPHEAMANGEAVARIDGKRFPFELERVEDPALWSTVSALAAAKYDLPVEPSDTSQMDTLWIFRMNDERS